MVLANVISMYLHKLFGYFVGPSLCTTKQCGQCVQLGVDDLQGPGGPAPNHQGPPTHHAARNGGTGTQGRGGRQVCCLWCPHPGCVYLVWSRFLYCLLCSVKEVVERNISLKQGIFFFYFCLICLSFCKNLISLDPLKLVLFIFKANESWFHKIYNSHFWGGLEIFIQDY